MADIWPGNRLDACIYLILYRRTANTESFMSNFLTRFGAETNSIPAEVFSAISNISLSLDVLGLITVLKRKACSDS